MRSHLFFHKLILGSLLGLSGAAAQQAATETSPPNSAASCVVIRQVDIQDLPASFSWLRQETHGLVGHCLDADGVQAVLRKTTDELANRGYVTSRLYVPEQDAGSGTLKLLFVTGRVHDIQVKGIPLNARRALPLRRGEILTTRATNQATDNLRRLTSLDSKVLIEPADAPGESNVTLAVNRVSRGYHGSVSVGQDDLNHDFVQVTDLPPIAQRFVQLPFQVAVDIDNPFKQADVLSLNAVVSPGALFKDGGTLSIGGRYSLPVGYSLLGFGGSYTINHTLQPGYNDSLDYNGRSANFNTDISRVVFRDEKHTFTVFQKFNIGLAWSYINDQEIDVQRKNTYRSITGGSYAYNTPETQITFGLNNELTYNDFLNLPDTSGWSDIVQPTFSYTHNFEKFKKKWQYSALMTGQLTVSGEEFQPFVVDNSVIRGLPSEIYFSAPHAFSIQNRLLLQLRPAFSPYFTLDGAWFSKWKDVEARTVWASTLGFQGQWKKLTYDVRAGLPLNLSKGTRLNYGVQLSWLF